MSEQPILYIRDSASLAALWQEAARKAFPQFNSVTELDPGQLEAVEVALVWKPKPGFLASLKNLKLVVSVGAGVDHIVGHDTAYPRQVPLVRMVDPGLTYGMCDYVCWAALSHLRQSRYHLVNQRLKIWQQEPIETSDQKTVAVFGLGQIGAPVAKRLAAQGFNVIGWSRTAKKIEGIESFSGSDGFDKTLGQADMVVNLLPSTPETQNMFGAAAFAAMKPGVCFINAGRGTTVDENALHAALQSGQVGEAFLDVFRQEPLPEQSALWIHPRVTITPHNAAITHPSSGIRAVERALDEMEAGVPLSNLVDWDRGY